MFRSERIVFATLFALASAACSFIYDVGNLEKDAPAGSSSEAGASSDCPVGRGPSSVRVRFDGGTFCVDSTEVTNTQYAAFVTAKGSDTSGQPAVCATNTSYAPTMPAQGVDDAPVAFVDWCDARAYCEWAGKRLCGTRVDAQVTRDEWFTACSHDGTRAYPYGNTYDPNACNSNGRFGKPIAVGTLPGCVGGYDGIFDMSGNLSEWEDACTSGDLCPHRGGAYYSNDPTTPKVECSSAGNIARLDTFSDVGIRCCSD
jgi:formylglycine-generating enzyme required for sulfatase activity